VVAAALCLVLGEAGPGYAGEPTTAAPLTATSAAAASPYLVLTAASLDATGLAYVGTFTVVGPAGATEVLRFTMTAGALTGSSLASGCAESASMLTRAASASLAGATFDAVRLAVTVGGTPVTFTPAAPPTDAFPTEVLLQDVALTATTVAANTMDVRSSTTEATTC
jgi:hypothetical protein